MLRHYMKLAEQRFIWAGLLLALLLSACRPGPAATPRPTRPPRPIPTAMIIVEVPDTPITPTPDIIFNHLAALAGNEGIIETMRLYIPANEYDPEGSKTAAYNTLSDFINPIGSYSGAWWFQDDGKADLYEILAVIFFTEGDRNVRVQQAIAARYLWYCGGAGAACNGNNLINFLAYFQPWREPWMAGSRFTNPGASAFLAAAQDLVLQRPDGIATEWIPGADLFIATPDSLEDDDSAINWDNTPFHFANVHTTWDTHLRQTLGRGPDGANRLWVLTISDAQTVCRSEFVCDNMTLARTP